MAILGFKPNMFYYNFFQIEKSFNIYINLKHIATFKLNLDAKFLICKLIKTNKLIGLRLSIFYNNFP